MSGSLEKAFLADMVANIDDDTPRLVYADWLEENGQDDRAEFIRVQIERARLPAWDAKQVRLRLREAELLKKQGEAWLAELPTIPGAKWEGFRRGIIAEVSFTSFEAMRASVHLCREAAPIEAVTVRWPRQREAGGPTPPIAELRELSLTGRPDSEDEVGWLADSPQLSTLRCLTAHGLWAEGLERLVESPHLVRLAVLRLPSNNLGNEGILALIGAAAMNALQELDISGRGVSERYQDDSNISPPGMDALATWSGLATVRSLNLSENDIGRAGLRTLLRSRHAAALKVLSLRGTRLDGQAMAEFRTTVSGLHLEVLDLGENLLREVGAEYVATTACLRELKELRLDRCEIPLAGARHLAKKGVFLDGLRRLEVGFNHFGPAGLTALLERQPPLLHTLGLRDNDLFDRGATILAESPASDVLLDMDLSRNHLSSDGAASLGATAYLRNLLVLRLRENNLSESGEAAIRDSALGRRLAVVELADPDVPPRGPDDIPF